MKTIGQMGLIGLMAFAAVSCGKPESGDGLAQAQLQIMKKMAMEHDELESENQRLEARIMELELQLATALKRLEIAKDSCKLYETLLNDSNAAKLERARDNLRRMGVE